MEGDVDSVTDDEDEYVRTVGFQVFEADMKWKVVNNLGNNSFFIGNNSSFSV